MALVEVKTDVPLRARVIARFVPDVAGRATLHVAYGAQKDIRAQVAARMPKAGRLGAALAVKPIRDNGGRVTEVRLRSKAIYMKRRAGPVDLYTVHGIGVVVSPGGGKRYLAIPTEYAPAGSRLDKKMPYAEAAARFTLQLKRSRSGWVAGPPDRKAGEKFPIWYVLIPQATIPKRLDLQAAIERRVAAWPGYIEDEWQKAEAEAGVDKVSR